MTNIEGIVYDNNENIVGYRISEDVLIPFTKSDIYIALKSYAYRKLAIEKKIMEMLEEEDPYGLR